PFHIHLRSLRYRDLRDCETHPFSISRLILPSVSVGANAMRVDLIWGCEGRQVRNLKSERCGFWLFPFFLFRISVVYY
ncbi:hypothetical protein CUMW_044910, partial [Citrus unshiu]